MKKSNFALRLQPSLMEEAKQELAGHQDLDTTRRYMHLSPAALDAAIRLLDEPGPAKAGHYVRAGSKSPTYQFTNLLTLSEESFGLPDEALK